MPVYDYECRECGLIPDVTAPVRYETMRCPECGRQMKRLFSPPMRVKINDGCDLTPYIDPNLGPKPILVESRKHKRELLRERGFIIADGGYT